MIKNKLNCITPERFFLCGLIFLVCLTVIQFPIRDGEAFFSLLHPDTDDIFMDLFNSIYDVKHPNPYIDRNVIYPPLTYLYYKAIGLMFPVKENPESSYDALVWRNSQSGIIIVFLITAITVYLLYRIFLQAQDKTRDSSKAVLWILLGTVPFWYVYERGNITLQTLLFLAYFTSNYRSNKLIRRENALICLAIAAAFKIYPAIFGILLLIDKQYKAAIRCIIYGVLFFLLPFAAFGGIESLFVMLSNIMSTTQVMMQRGYGYKVNIDNTLDFLSDFFQFSLSPMVDTVVTIVLVVCTVYVLLFTHKDWQRHMALCTVMIIFPGFSYTYTLIFAAIPLIIFIQNGPKTNVRNMLFSILYLGMFAPFPFGGYTLFDNLSQTSPYFIYPMNLTTVIASLSLIGMILLMVMDVLFDRHAKEISGNETIVLP